MFLMFGLQLMVKRLDRMTQCSAFTLSLLRSRVKTAKLPPFRSLNVFQATLPLRRYSFAFFFSFISLRYIYYLSIYIHICTESGIQIYINISVYRSAPLDQRYLLSNSLSHTHTHIYIY